MSAVAPPPTGPTALQTGLLAASALATLAAAGARVAGVADVAAFVIAGIALAGLAWVVSFATEQVGSRFGPARTGLLQATLGNLPEFFVVLFALQAGQVVVAQTSLLGSLFSNALLVLGLVLVVGARRAPDGRMRFRPRLPNDTATLLLVATFVIVVVGLTARSDGEARRHIEAISLAGAAALLVVYGTWVASTLRSDEVGAETDEPTVAALALRPAVALLAVAGVAAALVSELFVEALGPAIADLGISQAFAGLVIVAIAGNAVEHVVGIVLAAKGRSDLAISVVKNSVAQVAAFLFPALVVVSALFATPLTFALDPVFIGALLVTAIAIWQVTGDGQAYAFQGVALIALYLVLAAFAWVD